jgi:hypothetical protein
VMRRRRRVQYLKLEATRFNGDLSCFRLMWSSSVMRGCKSIGFGGWDKRAYPRG